MPTTRHRAKNSGRQSASREATKRGFPPGTKKVIQVVTDGDEALAAYTKEFFPTAIHTLDVMHALEYLWDAGACLYPEGSTELLEWMDLQKKRLYEGAIEAILVELRKRRLAIPLTGPGNKGKRERLTDSIFYLGKRTHQMHYGKLIAAEVWSEVAPSRARSRTSVHASTKVGCAGYGREPKPYYSSGASR